jgi:probable F420-dependent oxidoreductase
VISAGVVVPTRLAAIGAAEPLEFVALAERIEALGFDSVWVGDSLLARPRPEPLTLLAAMAARTRRIGLGTAVLLPLLRHHPLVTAHAAASLDRLAEGRLVLGVGAGFPYPPSERELAAVGAGTAARGARLAETVEALRALWAGAGPVSYRGRYLSFEDVALEPRPSRRGGPPIWLGGNGPLALRRAGRLADGWLPTSATPQAFADGWKRVCEAASAAGRAEDAVTPALLATLSVHADEALAERVLRRFMESYYGVPLEPLSRVVGCFAGSAERCADWLLGFARAGVRHFVLRFAGDEAAGPVERAAGDLLPRLRAAARALPPAA